MDEDQESKNKWTDLSVKPALSLAMLLPLYALLYITFAASLVAARILSAVLVAALAPWEDLKKKFLS